MHQRLRSLLSGISTPAQADLIVRAVALAEERGFVDFQDSLEQDMLGMADQPGEITQYIMNQRLVPFFSDMLQNMGVELAEDTSLSDYIDVTDWLCKIENFDDVSTINNIALSDNDDAEILADVLAVISAKSNDEIFPLFETVSPYLIKRIAELTVNTQVIPAARAADPSYTRAVQRMQKLLPVLTGNPAYVVHAQVIADFVKMGAPPTAALGELMDVYPQLSRDGKACATVVICVASNLADDELSERCSDFIKNNERDVMAALAVIKIADRLIMEAVSG